MKHRKRNRKRNNEEDTDVLSNKFPLGLLQTILFVIIDWDQFWNEDLSTYSPRWTKRNGDIKRYSNPYILMKAIFISRFKSNYDIKKLHKVLENLESWTELTISHEDLRSIAKGRTLGNDQLNSDCLDREETFLKLTRENLKCLDVKIDGTDFSVVSGRAWAIASRFQRGKFIDLFDRLKKTYMEKFPDKKYHTHQSRWVNRVASDYDARVVASSVPLPVPSPVTPICPSMDISEEILFRGDLGDGNNLILPENDNESMSNMGLISSQGYGPVWHTQVSELPKFNEHFVEEEYYLFPPYINESTYFM
ncbi:10403_t:CDS:1 [Dentiscutata erythropus]|uniref:10403_t:CDS:1 n=1 Tax=Dentiscutata erythropus TaxID=1348616 RepID=A0A9N8VK54_9GLOM|nr:10403_t:CDS:1 [Dentiscutata erythropus]